MTITDLVQGFSERWTTPVSEEDGTLRLTFKGGISITCRTLHGATFVVEGVLGPLPGEDFQAKAHLQQVLQVSLSQFRNSKETLAFDENSGQLVIFRSGNAEEVSEADFDALIERFVNRLEYWQRIARPASSNYSFGLTP